MKRNQGTLLVAVMALFAAPSVRAEPVNYQMVNVGDAGNAADTTGYGAVAYDYAIGKYDVVISQYTAFLNAVAKTDPYGLYDTRMATAINIAGIARGGSSGAYTYSVMTNGGDSGNRPITQVSWFDSARFANWMANGQPTGAQSASTTENGVYNLNGAISGNAPVRNAMNPNTGATPTFWIPTENEWYKAAYFQPQASGGPSDNYWSYATMSDSEPGNVIGSAANQANYQLLAGFSVTQSPTYSATQNYLTAVGAFTGSASHYGTFDQSGLVNQWNDLSATSGSKRGVRGGDWSAYYTDVLYLSSGGRQQVSTSTVSLYVGFRLAGQVNSTSVPEIDPAGMGSVLALVTGVLGLLERRRLKAAWPKLTT